MNLTGKLNDAESPGGTPRTVLSDRGPGPSRVEGNEVRRQSRAAPLGVEVRSAPRTSLRRGNAAGRGGRAEAVIMKSVVLYSQPG
jgi:hypothetical protein